MNTDAAAAVIQVVVGRRRGVGAAAVDASSPLRRSGRSGRGRRLVADVAAVVPPPLVMGSATDPGCRGAVSVSKSCLSKFSNFNI